MVLSAGQVGSAASAQLNFVILFANAVATDTSILADATIGGTVAIIPANRAAQALLATDAHIDSAVSAMFNSFITEPNG